MGLFGAKGTCAICESSISAFTRVKLSDGEVCAICAHNCSPIESIELKTVAQVKQRLQDRSDNLLKYKSFSPTDSVPGRLEVDKVNKLWCALVPNKKNPELFSFSDLIDYEFLEDGVSITRGGLGSAAVGGLAFGGVGAIVGGGLGKKQKDVITSMSVVVTVRSDFVSRIEFRLISSETKKGGFIHKNMKDTGNQIVSLLHVISDSAAQQNAVPAAVAAAPVSAADELMKFKQLLDMGAISAEEYDAKKKQLLDL